MLDFIYQGLTTLYDIMGFFLPLFILITVFQLSLTIFCGYKYFISPQLPENEEASLFRLNSMNQRISNVAMNLALIGTMYGMLIALLQLAANFAENNEFAVIEMMEGASIALSSTLAGLLLARLWGKDINDWFIQALGNKLEVPVSEETVLQQQLALLERLDASVTHIVKLIESETENNNGSTNTEVLNRLSQVLEQTGKSINEPSNGQGHRSSGKKKDNHRKERDIDPKEYSRQDR